MIQRLFATGLMLESAQRGSLVPEVRQGVGNAVDELDVTIQEIRTAIFALQQGPAEAPSGLRTRVLREINMAAVPLGFKPGHRFVGAVDTTVGDLTGKNLIAALREALSNAFRHAAAARIEVVVDATATLPDGRPGVRLTVADDGAASRRAAAAAASRTSSAGPSPWAATAGTGRASARTAAVRRWCGRPRTEPGRYLSVTAPAEPPSRLPLSRSQQRVPHAYDLNRALAPRAGHDRWHALISPSSAARSGAAVRARGAGGQAGRR